MSAMRRPKKVLTAALIRQSLPAGKYFDGEGLYLRVQANGSRQWVQRITIRRKRCELGLGSPPTVSLAEARDAAVDNVRAVRAGQNPLADRRRNSAVLSFEEAAKRVHELHKPTWRNEKHAADFLNSLTTYAFPKLGLLRVSEITTSDVLAVLSPIWTEKSETARRVRQRIGTVLKWAIAQGWRQDNPAENIGHALPKQTRIKVHRLALPYAEVAGCIEAVQLSNAWISTKLALEFLILTAARSGEVRLAHWDEIHFGLGKSQLPLNAVWELPPDRMKAKRAHRVPLTPRAIAILNQAAKLRGESGLIFPSQRGTPLSDMTLSKLIKELGFNADVHGFRTSFRTWTQEKTHFPREVAEAALAHAVGDSVEAAYARSDLFVKRRNMMNAWSSFIANSGQQREEVVRIAS